MDKKGQIDYSKGKIYSIRNTIDDDIYVGSTVRPLYKRLQAHRSCVKNNRLQCLNLYTKMKELGMEHFYIELVEECPCENVEQLKRREGQVIREIATLNMCIAGRSKQEYDKEYRENNKDKKHQQYRNYYEQNTDKVKQQINAWASRPYVCECGETIRRDSLNKHLKSTKHKTLLEELNKSSE